jgi:hypothetical protein
MGPRRSSRLIVGEVLVGIWPLVVGSINFVKVTGLRKWTDISYKMLSKYEVLPNGIIKQKEGKPVVYDSAYSAKYNKFGERGTYLSHLRYGVLLGAIGRAPESIVDVGYGNGSFLNVCCAAKIPRIYGCDVSDFPPPDGVEKIAVSDIRAVDVVCFFDSLEHFPDISFVKDLDTWFVYISVPWCHYPETKDADWFKAWYHRRENEHIYHFGKETLLCFFDECGYDCIYTGSHEDMIRQNPSVHPLPNILTAIFKRRV